MALDLKHLLGVGGKLTEFQSLLDNTAEELPADHPQKELLQRLSSMFRAQRAAVRDAMERFDQTAREQLAQSKAELEAFQKEFAPTREKLQSAVDAAKAGAGAPAAADGKAAKDVAAKVPSINIDPNFGMQLGKELVERYHGTRKPAKGFEDREIWQDWT